MNPLVGNQLLRILSKNKKAFFFGVLIPVLLVWWLAPAVVASFIFAIGFFGAMLFLVVAFFVNLWRGWNKR